MQGKLLFLSGCRKHEHAANCLKANLCSFCGWTISVKAVLLRSQACMQAGVCRYWLCADSRYCAKWRRCLHCKSNMSSQLCAFLPTGFYTASKSRQQARQDAFQVIISSSLEEWATVSAQGAFVIASAAVLQVFAPVKTPRSSIPSLLAAVLLKRSDL